MAGSKRVKLITSIHTTSFSEIRNDFLPKIAAEYNAIGGTVNLQKLPSSITEAEHNIEWSDRIIKDYSLWQRNIDPEIHQKILQIATIYQYAEKSRKDKLSKYKTSITRIKIGLGCLTVSVISSCSAWFFGSDMIHVSRVGPRVKANSIEGHMAQALGEALCVAAITMIIAMQAIMLFVIIPAITGIAMITFSTLFGSYHAWVHWDDHSKTMNQLKELRFFELINQCEDVSNDVF